MLRSLLLLIPLILFACTEKEIMSPNDGTGKPVVDKDFYRAFSLSDPHPEILHDPFRDLLYLTDRTGGQLVAYDYSGHQIQAQTTKSFRIADYALAIYAGSAGSQLYLANERSVQVYDGANLELRETIRVFEENDPRLVGSIEAPNEQLLLIGACNSAFQNGKKGSIALNRQTGNIVSQAEFGGNCLRLRSFMVSEDTIGVVGVGYATTDPELISDRYTHTGHLLDNRIEFFPAATTSLHLLKTNPQVDFFITSSEGNIFSKSSLELLGSLNGDYRDILISPDGTQLYGLTEDQHLEIIEYPSLDLVERRPLEAVPQRGFLDGDELLIVYYRQSVDSEATDIYLSRLKV